MTKSKPAKIQDPIASMGDGQPEDQAIVMVRGKTSGAAYFAPAEPAAYRRLSPEQQVYVASVQEHGAALVEMQERLDELVAEARSADVSWHLIGWSLGMTGEGARQRWGIA